MGNKRLIIALINILIFILISGCATENINNNNISIDYKKAALLNVELGRGYLAGGYTERAKKKFIHALELMPNLAEAHSGMGYFWEVVKEFKEAEHHYRKSIALGHGKGLFYNQYAVFLCERGRYKEANKNFMLAVADKFYDKTSEIYNNAAFCSLRNNDSVTAQHYFTKALHHDPRKIEILLDLAKLMLQQKEYSTSEHYLQQFYHANNSKPTAEYLALSIKTARYLGKEDVAASKALVLKNLFPNYYE